MTRAGPVWPHVPTLNPSKIFSITFKTWPDGAYQQLWNCFNITIWNIFEHQVLEVFTNIVLCYIMTCTDTVKATKHIYPNQKSWMTREVWQLPEERSRCAIVIYLGISCYCKNSKLTKWPILQGQLHLCLFSLERRAAVTISWIIKLDNFKLK